MNLPPTQYPPPPLANPNPNLIYPQHEHHHHHHHYHYPHPHLPSSTATATPPPPAPADLPSALSSLKTLIQLSESTLQSISNVLTAATTAATTTATSACPLNPHHRVPPQSLFRHYLRCPAASIDPHYLHNPNTVRSSNTQHHFLPNPATNELCFSLDDHLDSNFFYRDCAGVVTSTSHGDDSPAISFTLPPLLSDECANLDSTENDDSHRFSTACLPLLPSEAWLVRSETESWSHCPTFYSYPVLRSLLILCSSEASDFRNWLINYSRRRYGVVVDVQTTEHVILLFKLSLKAIRREAVRSADSFFTRDVKVLRAKSVTFECPVLVQVLMWFASQLSVLYGEANGKLFAVDMLKQCLLNVSLNAFMFSEVQKGRDSLASGVLDGEREEPRDEWRENKRNRPVGEPWDGSVMTVSQVAAAVAALHERSLLEAKIRALRDTKKIPNYQRFAEHSFVSKRADEERKTRSNYRPLLEHDGLFWQRARNQETNKLKSREELLAEERDYKRRRMSYRGKKMKRTTTQVMKDIIDEYMDEINQADGSGCLPKGAVTAEKPASEHISVHGISSPHGVKESVPSSSDVSREWSRGHAKQLISHKDIRSRKFGDESSEESKRNGRDSQWHNKHLEDHASNRSRHDSDYYYGSTDELTSSRRSREQRQQDDAKALKRDFPRSRDKSHCWSNERTSYRRDRVHQNVEDRDRHPRSSQCGHTSNSVAHNEFEDRYDPSVSSDVFEADFYFGSKCA
ncbi:hypothetical protein RJ639_039787 [Escallonia herrerae]|uniref:CHHC U11-48K-type domain-containing protein n=1 Tax=Escallonia herrerae TaxID=1293975 RepID=A0AA89BAH5_9ASTE|nr:hypothetical protein RJ639_039787 [Escallonia herrerae]